MECEPSENESTSPFGQDSRFEMPDFLPEYHTLDLHALSCLATSMANRIHHELEFGCYEEFLRHVILHTEQASSQLDDNQRQLLKLTETFNLFCGRDQVKKVIVDIIKHNSRVITDLEKSRTVLEQTRRVKFLRLFQDVENLASCGSCPQTLSPEQCFRILQVDSSDETAGNSFMFQTIADRTLDEIKKSLSSNIDDLLKDPLLKNHEASRVCAEISEEVTGGLKSSSKY